MPGRCGWPVREHFRSGSVGIALLAWLIVAMVLTGSRPAAASDADEEAGSTESRAEPSVAGRSPYADWPERGQRSRQPATGEPLELTPTQAEWINAAYGGQAYRAADQRRAGTDRGPRPHALCSDAGHYVGYYVGGGTITPGRGRLLSEGTFGWDYRGLIYHPRIMLGWSRGRQQGGTEGYRTDH